ncbi:MAG TPA: alginate lyase family protein [Thermoanaerobaculia bacterium]|jgi:uncharacterized heparinase superfamily protein|nr:alginate lyase family protein [Thermoanaerobaculia bacterium]
MIARVARLLRTVRHLGARQILTRVARVTERMWWRMTSANAPKGIAPPLREHVPLWRELEIDDAGRARGHEIVAGRFTFLNETREHPTWNATEASRLWRFHLEYFDYVRDLLVLAAAGEREVTYATFRDLVRSWIDAHRKLRGVGWQAYTASLRVVNWCEAAVFFQRELEEDPQFAHSFLDSIAVQTRFIDAHPETDVRGNHLLENARALVRAAFFFEGDEARRWLDHALQILEREIPEQILDDGGHFERVPGYHLRVMEVLDDIASLLRENDAGLQWIEDTTARMHTFLATITPANGRIPLLKDTAFGVRQPQLPLCHDSRWLSASGFAVIRGNGDHLIADFGRVCPDYLPAHAHADLFSFELTIDDQPVIVDSGAYEYAAGEWRSWFRSTPAHNTVSIDGRDQSEMYDSFRVGRRAQVRDVVWTQTPELTSISGTHDGFTPHLHHRTIMALHDRRAWIVLDRIDGPPGHVAKSYIHLHPDHPELNFTPLGAVTVEEEEGWYSEEFGVKRRNRVIVLSAETPAWFGYVIGS